MMKKLVTILLLFAGFAQAQDAHIRYRESGNSKQVGRDVLFRTDHANLDTLTSVYNGTFAYDTINDMTVYYNGSSWVDVNSGGPSWTSTGNYLYPTTITDSVGIGTTSPLMSLHNDSLEMLLGADPFALGAKMVVGKSHMNFGPSGVLPAPYLRMGSLLDLTSIGFDSGTNYWNADSIGFGSIGLGGANNRPIGQQSIIMGGLSNRADTTDGVIIGSTLIEITGVRGIALNSNKSTIGALPSGKSGSFLLVSDSSLVTRELAGSVGGFRDTIEGSHSVSIGTFRVKSNSYHGVFIGQLPPVVVDSADSWWDKGYLFIAGNGDLGTEVRGSAFGIRKDGVVWSGSVADPDTELQDSSFVSQVFGNLYVDGDSSIVKGKLHIDDILKLEPRASAPTPASAGDIYYNSGTNKLQVYNGTTWEDCN